MYLINAVIIEKYSDFTASGSQVKHQSINLHILGNKPGRFITSNSTKYIKLIKILLLRIFNMGNIRDLQRIAAMASIAKKFDCVFSIISSILLIAEP